MTLETTSGTVQLPVDVQAASRVADEKRRRNAGASARFRQRRKEKEKEASVTISRLEHQVKELSEDADFYKRERDYMAGLLVHLPGGERHFPRPQSPRRRRSSTTLQGSSGNVGVSTGFGTVAHDPSARSPQHSRAGRRRASTASLPPPPPTVAPQPGSHYQQAFASQQFGTPVAPQPGHGLQQAQGAMPSPMARSGLSHPSPLPPMQQQPGPSAPNLPQQLMQAPPQTGPWNP
ncbi:basic region leucin zipper [Teratosphaeria destructans]|uniref:Basic region leucin zipper n=1 Tax=Teratosphaeria destructans TaxID=418781 RepID=A0A9W7SUC4_9PEZI|nr:basic region leucin zipper [Teratosphaeria destructans]